MIFSIVGKEKYSSIRSALSIKSMNMNITVFPFEEREQKTQ